MSVLGNPQIESYVDKLTAPLQHTVDPAQLQEFRANILFHLESLVEESGGSIELALDQFGPAEALGLAMLDECSRGRAGLTFARSSSAAVWWSFATFGIAEAVTLLLIEATTMWPGGYGLKPLAQAAIWISPAVAGFTTGWFVPTGNLRALGLALIPIFVHALFAVMAINPYLFGAEFAAPALPFWIPLGALSLSLTAWVRRNRPLSHRSRSRLGATS